MQTSQKFFLVKMLSEARQGKLRSTIFNEAYIQKPVTGSIKG